MSDTTPTRVTLRQILDSGLVRPAAEDLLRRAGPLLAFPDASERWARIVQDVLIPDHPFALHKLLHEAAFADWDETRGPRPAWFPSEDDLRASNIASMMNEVGVSSYEELHAWSVKNREEFWAHVIRRLGIRFRRPWDRALDSSNGVESPMWLTGAQLNIAESCFAHPDGASAVIFQPEGGTPKVVTYEELRRQTNRFANGLIDADFGPGDVVAICAPMTMAAIAAYLGIVSAGCVVVSIAESFSSEEIASRLRLSRAKAVVTQDHIPRSGKHLPLYERIVSASSPRAIVLSCEDVQSPMAPDDIRLRDGDLTWTDFLSDRETFDPVSCRPQDSTNILFSSGTTGEPKAIPWNQITPIKCAADGHLHQDIHAGDVVAWPSSIGWMMGPWLIYASLINGATVALFYGPPTSDEFGRFVQDARVTVLGVVPSLVRAWRNSECLAGLDWSAVRLYSSTGECSDPDDALFLMSRSGYRPIIEYCGGTEIGGAYISGTIVQPAAPATFSTPALGIDFVICDERGHGVEEGEVFLIPPSIGLSTKLLNADHHDTYFAGTPAAGPSVPLRRHGDQLRRLGGRYYRMQGRVDDTMNLAGIKVSSAEIERVLNPLTGVRETAAIGMSPPGGGPSRLVIFAVLMPDADLDAKQLGNTFQDAIRRQLNALFRIHDVVIVDTLPRSASNKVMRRTLRQAYRGAPTS